jgi:3',5'-cyclic AMP phosphodiesterase CpdA
LPALKYINGMKLYLPLIILVLLSTAGSIDNRKSEQPFYLIQISDPQFGYYEANKGFGKETELYSKAIKAINRLNPDFIVITGDLVNNRKDRAQIEEFRRITATVNPQIPVYYSPGNHDIGDLPTQKELDLFRKDYGPDKFSFEHKGSIFIGINTCIIKANTPDLEQSQLDWLTGKLSIPGKAEHIVIFTHYPFFTESSDEPEAYFNIPVEKRNKYLTLFKAKNVDAIFAGHLHDNKNAIFGKIQMVTTGPVGKPLGKIPSGIRIIKVFHNRIESTYYGLDEIPESLGK